MSKVILLLSIVLAFTGSLSAQNAIPLDQAIKEGKVNVEISGVGCSTGDVIMVAVQRNGQEHLRITLTPGTVFKSGNKNAQSMMAGSIKGEQVNDTSYCAETVINLSDNKKHTYVVEAYCRDFHKDNPAATDSFVLAPPDEAALKVLRAGQAKGASIEAIQTALWMCIDKVKAEEVKKRFPVSDADVAVAQGLLQDVQRDDSGDRQRK